MQVTTDTTGKPRASPPRNVPVKTAATTGSDPVHEVLPVCVHAWGSTFDRLAEQLWAMMSEMEGRNYFRSHAPDSWRPRLNVYETPDRFFVCVELAGMPRDQIDVRAADGVLHISGLREKPTPPGDPDDVGVHLMEIDSGRFHCKVPIAQDVIIDEISAAYRQGYLWVMMPRATTS